MRKVLLVEDESYLERALGDVQNLFRFMGREFEPDATADLLAVIVMPAAAMERLTSQFQSCDLASVALGDRLFSTESISVNGRWLLLTLNRPDLLEPTSRHEALGRMLTILRDERYVKSIAGVFPVFPFEEPADSMAEQLDYLSCKHRDVLATSVLLVHLKQVYPSSESIQLMSIRQSQ